MRTKRQRKREKTQEWKGKARGSIQEVPNSEDSRKNQENRRKEIIQETTEDKLPQVGHRSLQMARSPSGEWKDPPQGIPRRSSNASEEKGSPHTHTKDWKPPTAPSPRLQHQKLKAKSGARTLRQWEKMISNLEFHTQPSSKHEDGTETYSHPRQVSQVFFLPHTHLGKLPRDNAQR